MLGLGNSLITGGVSSEWTVASIPELGHWFRHRIGLEVSTGDELVTWGDDYGDLVWEIAAGKVLKNGGDVDFDTHNGRMQLADESVWNPGTFSVYVVARVRASSISNAELLALNSSNFFRISNSTTSRIQIGGSTASDITLPGDAIAQNIWFVFGIEWDGSTVRLYQDTDYSTPTTNPDSDTFAGLNSLGKRGSPFDGEMREIVMVNNVLSDVNRELLMTHLISISRL
mgnify:CR=1 FL=1